MGLFPPLLLFFILGCSLVSAELNPVAVDESDIIVDDMIYGRDQYYQNYFNIR